MISTSLIPLLKGTILKSLSIDRKAFLKSKRKKKNKEKGRSRLPLWKLVRTVIQMRILDQVSPDTVFAAAHPEVVDLFSKVTIAYFFSIGTSGIAICFMV